MSTAPASSLELVHSLVPTRAKPDELRRRELGAFLRSRRERISPEQVGLPSIGRRRTPGLRREEVAQLAAVGVTWYTWLEQARDIQVSAQVLDAIARGLLLDRVEREHLFSLAGTSDPNSVPRECPVVTPPVRAVLEQLSPMPAVVLNARFDIIGFNDVYSALCGGLDRFEPEALNLLWLAFTDPGWRTLLVDWEAAARGMTAKFRVALAEHVAEPKYKSLLKRLQLASPEFAAAWEHHDVTGTAEGTKRFLHPEVGLLNFEYTNLWLGPRPGYRMITYVPADPVTKERVAQLAASVGSERVGQ
ncbi:helix-turn-helix transcriptional regulator [Streptacidiphilus fuscans]|uniref:Helix-turn-helix domain-containing protein n=1 Tax=Streptacidiphilus fuscans TaxID=2789292 RepID=A0A931BBB5_9ACTN|nr:helix-turn-helix transcriptional regulator [Streptacidiphilus fuscans]MBF9070275.1 helix-turn-helix domain-containing protein [Streptacidiphilus fuscans]